MPDEHALLVAMRKVLLANAYNGEYGTCQECDADMELCHPEDADHTPCCGIGHILKETAYLLKP